MQNLVSDTLVTLSGTVTNQSSPAVGAELLYTIDCSPYTTNTDSQGNYSFSAPVDSAVFIRTDVPGVNVTPDSYAFTVSAEQSELNFVIMPNVSDTYTIGGAVSGLNNNAGVQVLFSINGQNGSTSTDTMGNYSFDAPVGAVVEIMPSAQSGFTAAPSSYRINGVSGNVCGQSFVYSGGSIGRFTVSGTVSGLPAVSGAQVFYTVNGTPATATADVFGNYSFTAPSGSAITIVPSIQAGFTAAPDSYQIASLLSNQGGQDFVYSVSPGQFTVSGAVIGLPSVSGIAVLYTIDGTQTTTTTDELGNYSFLAPSGSAVAIIPSVQSGFTVTPPLYQIASLSGNQSGQDFVYAGSTSQFSVSGTISGLPSVSNVQILYTVNGVVRSTMTDALGNYTLTAPAGSVISIIPASWPGYAVSPANHQITSLTGNLTGRNFVYTGSIGAFTISGTLSGLPSNVGLPVTYTINGIVGSVTTDATGSYVISAPTGANVVILPPARAAYAVTPGNYTVANLASNLTGRNFFYTAG